MIFLVLIEIIGHCHFVCPWALRFGIRTGVPRLRDGLVSLSSHSALSPNIAANNNGTFSAYCVSFYSPWCPAANLNFAGNQSRCVHVEKGHTHVYQISAAVFTGKQFAHAEGPYGKPKPTNPYLVLEAISRIFWKPAYPILQICKLKHQNLMNISLKEVLSRVPPC